MVKLEDGSMVLASQLISGAGEDDNGKKIKFDRNQQSEIPTYKAEAPLNDGTGRKKIYSFDIADTPVRVSVAVVNPEEQQQQQQQQEQAQPQMTEAKVVKTDVPNQSAAPKKSPSVLSNF